MVGQSWRERLWWPNDVRPGAETPKRFGALVGAPVGQVGHQCSLLDPATHSARINRRLAEPVAGRPEGGAFRVQKLRCRTTNADTENKRHWPELVLRIGR